MAEITFEEMREHIENVAKATTYDVAVVAREMRRHYIADGLISYETALKLEEYYERR